MTELVGKMSGQQVYVVDDDANMREAISEILRTFDIAVVSFESTGEFLRDVPAGGGGCLVLDVRMPGVNGLDFHLELSALGYRIPVIFITGFGNIPMSVQAMKAGAMDFLTKPFTQEEIVTAVSAALERDQIRRNKEAENDVVLSLARNLTNRERQVMVGVVKGLMNKQIAHELSLTEITVKLHRASLMRKMQVRTLPDLVRRAELISALSELDISSSGHSRAEQ